MFVLELLETHTKFCWELKSWFIGKTHTIVLKEKKQYLLNKKKQFYHKTMTHTMTNTMSHRQWLIVLVKNKNKNNKIQWTNKNVLLAIS